MPFFYTPGAPNGEEVTYQDLFSGTAKEETGYRKLNFCREQAAKDGLHHFWIDTCCIDKVSSAELSEAIVFMLPWYSDSVQCYLFLSDVSVEEEKTDYDDFNFTGKFAFRTSRWFSRGWTLQELLAPSVLRYFSGEGQQLGDKLSLEKVVSEIMHIPILALRNKPLHTFSVQERMSWTKNRQTTREEDEAYALLGLFGISMLPIYGEGKEHVLKRLRNKIIRYSGDELQKFDSKVLLGATQALSSSKTRMFTVVYEQYCPNISTLLAELSCDNFNIQSYQMQNQHWTRCSDTISTTADNKSVPNQAKRSDHDITFIHHFSSVSSLTRTLTNLYVSHFHLCASC
jgi:hypothetical protein